MGGVVSQTPLGAAADSGFGYQSNAAASTAGSFGGDEEEGEDDEDEDEESEGGLYIAAQRSSGSQQRRPSSGEWGGRTDGMANPKKRQKRIRSDHDLTTRENPGHQPPPQQQPQQQQQQQLLPPHEVAEQPQFGVGDRVHAVYPGDGKLYPVRGKRLFPRHSY